MKKVFISLWILICCTFTWVVNAAEVDISDVVNALNNGNVARSYKEAGGSIKATYDSDSVDIKVDVNNEKYDMSFSLDGNIVTAYIDKNDKDSFSKAFIMQELIEEASILHGYTYGEVTNMINSGVFDDYTIGTHGLEQKLDSNGNLEVKVDVSKKIPSAKLDDVYLEKADLESYKEYITGDGSCGKTKGNVYFYMTTQGTVKNIVLAEKGGITANSYMSFRTIIDIMFDGNANIISMISSYVPDFNYSVVYDGVSVNLNELEIKGEVSDYDYLKENGYSIILIKIDKAALQITGDIVEDGTSDDENNTQIEEEKEKTEKEKKDKSSTLSPGKSKIIMIIGILIVLLVIIMIVINMKRKSTKKLKLASGNKGVIQPSMMQTRTTDEIVESLDDSSTLAVQNEFNNSFGEIVGEQNIVQQTDISSFDNQSPVQMGEMVHSQDVSFAQPIMQDVQGMNQDIYNQQPVMDSNMYVQNDMNQMVQQQPQMMNNQFSNDMTFKNNSSFDNNMNNNQNN